MTEKSKPIRSYSPKERKGLFGEGDWQAHFDNVVPKKGGKITCGIKLLKSGKLVNSSTVNLNTVNSRNQLVKDLAPEEMKEAKEFLTLLQIWLEAELTKRKKTEKRESKAGPKEKDETNYRQLYLSDNEYVTWTPGAARLVHTKVSEATGDEYEASDRIVIINPPRPKRRLIIDEEVFHEVEDEGKIVTMTVVQLHQRLRDRGRITLASRAMDVLSIIISEMTEETYEGHATYGVYSEDGKLVTCETPHPMKTDQRKVQKQIEKNIPYVPTRADIQAYVDFLKFYHPHEILPKLGFALIAPYSPTIRANSILLPSEISVGPHDTGKNTGSEAVSRKGYGVQPIGGGTINSEFRLLSILDSCCLPISINEANKIKSELWSEYKNFPESWHAGERGKADLTTVDFNSRATLLHTCNEFPLTGLEEVLKRFDVTRFTEEDRIKRARKGKEFKALFRTLHPAFFQLQRWWVEAHPTEEELLNTIYDYEKQISDEYEKQGHTWMSPQRAQGWACKYLGLKVFELGCTKTGVDWHAPSIPWFVENVDAIIEEMTWSQSRSNVSLFASWLRMFLLLNKKPTRTSTGETEFVTLGQDEIWCYGEVAVEGRAVPVKGKWTTMELVDEYKRRNRDTHNYTLIELGKEAADKAGIPYEKVLKFDTERKTWVTKPVRMGDTTPKAVFIPDSLDEGWEIQTKPDQFEKDDRNEWTDSTEQDVTQSYPKLPMKVTENNDLLDVVSNKKCDPVTHNSRAHEEEKNIASEDEKKKCSHMRGDEEEKISSHVSVGKIGKQGNIGPFSGVWPSVTHVGNNGSHEVTEQPEKPEEQLKEPSNSHSSAPTQLEKRSESAPEQVETETKPSVLVKQDNTEELLIERRIRKVIAGHEPFFDAVLTGCAEAMGRYEKFHAWHVRTIGSRLGYKEGHTIVELLTDESYLKDIRRIAETMLITARKEAPP